jgi:hypothetical protein
MAATFTAESLSNYKLQNDKMPASETDAGIFSINRATAQ